MENSKKYLPKLRELSKKNKKHIYKLYDPQYKRILAIEEGINQLRPPLFWKDKSNFIIQSKIWNSLKIRKAIEKIHDLDFKLGFRTAFKHEKGESWKDLTKIRDDSWSLSYDVGFRLEGCSAVKKIINRCKTDEIAILLFTKKLPFFIWF